MLLACWTDQFACGLLLQNHRQPTGDGSEQAAGDDVAEKVIIRAKEANGDGSDHKRIERWRRRESLRATRARRPDLFQKLRLTDFDLRLLDAGDDEL